MSRMLGGSGSSKKGNLLTRFPFVSGLFVCLVVGGLVAALVLSQKGESKPAPLLVTPTGSQQLGYLDIGTQASTQTIRRAARRATELLSKEVASCKSKGKAAVSCVRLAVAHLQASAQNNAVLMKGIASELKEDTPCGQWVTNYQALFAQIGLIARDLLSQISAKPQSWPEVSRVIVSVGKDAMVASNSRNWQEICSRTAVQRHARGYRL